MKNSVRVSFDLPLEEHIFIKMECARNRIAIREFLHGLVAKGVEEYKKCQLNTKLRKSLKDSKSGKGRIISEAELDDWEASLDNE
jgi:hypothetical protein